LFFCLGMCDAIKFCSFRSIQEDQQPMGYPQKNTGLTKNAVSDIITSYIRNIFLELSKFPQCKALLFSPGTERLKRPNTMFLHRKTKTIFHNDVTQQFKLVSPASISWTQKHSSVSSSLTSSWREVSSVGAVLLAWTRKVSKLYSSPKNDVVHNYTTYYLTLATRTF